MKYSLNILNILSLILLYAVVYTSCSKSDVINGSLEIVSDRVLISDIGTPVHVEIDANTEWRIEYDTDSEWFSTDLMGGKASTKGFNASATANTSESIRSIKVRVFTSDHAVEKELTIIQLSSYPFISFESSQMSLVAASATYKLPLMTNIADESNIIIIASEDWITESSVSDGILKFTSSENTGPSPRSCSIQLEYTDENGRTAESILKVSQAAPSKYNSATPVDLSSALAMNTGKITQNIYVEGIITSTGASRNMPANRYILQSETGNIAIVMESSELIAFSRFNKVRIALMDTEVVNENEGNCNYKVFKGLTTGHLLKFEEHDFAVPMITISELTEDMNFCTVTLTDVEAAINAGAYTNFKTCWPGNEEQKQPDYFVKKFPDFYRYYPIPLRDKNADHIYMLSKIDTPWAHTTLPKGSGTVTGILMNVKLTNFDLDEMCIIPLEDSDIRMDTYTSTVSEIIAEWNCDFNNKTDEEVEEMTEYNPDAGMLAGQSGVILNKSGNKGFSRWYADNILGYQDSFRGDANLDDSEDGWNNTLSGGYYGRVNGGAFNSKPWDENEYFYIDGISTENINGRLSLQVSMNLSSGSGTFVIEHSDSVTSPTWTPISEFSLYGQFDRSSPERQTEKDIPGYKFFDFSLPESLAGQENICIRIRPTSMTTTPWSPVRLDHISLRYNK